MADDRKITIQIDESIKNSISPTQTLDELNKLPNGSYYAKEAGVYAFGVTVEDNQMIIFNKKGSDWVVLSKVEFPSNEIDVKQNYDSTSTDAISGAGVAEALKDVVIKTNTVEYVNILTTLDTTNNAGVNMVVNSDNINIKSNGTSGWKNINLLTDNGKYFKLGNEYLLVFDLIVNKNSLTEGTTSSAGNNRFTINAKANSSSKGLSKTLTYTSSVVTGERQLVYNSIKIDNEDNFIDTARWVTIQFGNYTVEQDFDINIYAVSVVNLTEWNLKKDEAFELVKKNGIKNNNPGGTVIHGTAERAEVASYAEVAGSINNLNISSTIDLWGDSLVAQGYGDIISKLLNRGVVTHGFGGKKSSYIRDKFLADENITKRPQVINIGRNNYMDYDTVINDIRTMVNAMGHNNFLICMPPNGDYGTINGNASSLGELKGGTRYDVFIRIQNWLSNEYANNFLNTREGSIYSYNMGGIKLVNEFVQPALNEDVTIQLSNTSIFSNLNSADITKFGEEFMNKVVIGMNGVYDIYSIVSVDSSTQLNLKLIEQNRITSGNNVSNLTDDGGDSSVIYLNIFLYADYILRDYDTTQSSFRIDGVHMSEAGKNCLANVVARKINSIKI
ncbi:hypothetical protein [Chishuiella sp.]|uniref:hypothetical protein n=1 Tax=Chishuiella sp. TaxID=1969467 RepID=UPI0028A61490|nr:hypothetical protein [Chishuiella sp.]